MTSSSDHVALLRRHAHEYERTIARFEELNAELRRRHSRATKLTMQQLERHIALNVRAIETINRGLLIVQDQLKQATAG